MRLRDFTVLTFDCYGTLIDWEAGIISALQPLLSQAAHQPTQDQVLERFAHYESQQQAATPTMRYSELLATVHAALAEDWGIAANAVDHQRFGDSVPEWPAFPDAPATLQYLKQHHTLVVLSNVDSTSFRGSAKRLDVDFDAVYTAEEIGSYKPDLHNFTFMLDQLRNRGIAPENVLHVAQSMFHDHVPAKHAGLATAWIDRRHDKPGWGATMPPPATVQPDFHFTSMAEFAAAHQGGAR